MRMFEGAMVGRKRGQKRTNDDRMASVLPGLVLFAGLLLVCHWQNWHTAQPKPADCSSTSFSEGRAMQTVSRLANDLPHRQMGAQHYQAASHFLAEEARNLQKLAGSREDLNVEVVLEQATGAVDLEFLHTGFTNAYINLTNVVLVLTPTAAKKDTPAVLLNAHFDSTLGSPGASDCAGCVGVALETARLLVQDRSRQLQAPLVVLLNGGEEAFLLGAHAFANSSKYRALPGAVINLESTGPGGPDLVFQHEGAWAMQSYARAATRPRGTIIAQDFFETGVLPADTDFRLLSSKYMGTLPGIDMASLLDSGAYHMQQDVPERIRPGTLQAMGENVVELVLEFSGALSRGEQSRSEEVKMVFWDFLGLVMVTYPMWLARLLHRTPLAIAVTLPLIMSSMGSQSRAKAGVPIGQVVWAAAISAASFVTATILPAALAAAMVFVTGQPMMWAGRPLMAYLLYVPAAVAGALLPHMVSGRMHPQHFLWGFALFTGALAELLSWGGLGLAYTLAAWAMCALGLATVCAVGDGGAALHWVVLSAAPAILGVAPSSMMLSLHLLQKAATSGTLLAEYGSDIVAAIVIGLVVMGCCGYVLHMLAVIHQWHLKVIIIGLLLFSVVFGVGLSQVTSPYTPRNPKKVYLHHTHHLVEGSGGLAVNHSTWDVVGIDSVPVWQALPKALANRQELRFRAQEHINLYPVNNFMQGMTLVAMEGPSQQGFPVLDLFSWGCIGADSPGGACSRHRLHMQLRMPAPAFYGAMNFSGDLRAWSFTDFTWPDQEHEMSRIVRFAGSDGSELWNFWVDIGEGGRLRMDVAAATLAENQSHAARAAAAFPEWCSVAASEVFQFSWQL